MKLLRAIAWALCSIVEFALFSAALPFVRAAEWLAEGLQ